LVEIAGAQGFEELEEQALAFVRGFHHDRLLSASRRVEFCECFARDAHRVDAGRYAAVDGDLQQDFADLLARDTIRERTLDMDLELMRSVERADHREVDEAAVATLETGSAPDATPAILRGEFLHGATEVVGTGEGLFHVLLAKHGLADFQSALIQILVHDLLPRLGEISQPARSSTVRAILVQSESG